MAVGIAIVFVVFLGHTLVALAGAWAALRARLWGAFGAIAFAGAFFDAQALPPWPPRMSFWAIGGSLAACVVEIVP